MNTKLNNILPICGWLSGNGGCAADSFVNGLKPVIFVGRLLGMFSRRDLLCESELRCSNCELIFSGFLIVFFLINFILQSIANFKRLQKHEATSQKLYELVLPGYSFTLFFIFAYISYNTKKLRMLIKKLSVISREFTATQIQPSVSVSKFPRFCFVVLVVILVYGMLENVAYDVQVLAAGNANSTLERYYTQLAYHWADISSYNAVLTLMGVVLLKVGTYGWVFGDILTIVLCRALTERLRDLSNEIRNLMDHIPAVISMTKKMPNQGNKIKHFTTPWDNVRKQYLTLAELVQQVGKFISPLILSCYGINVYLITINLFLWMSPNASHSTEQTFYNYFAFAHFSFRVSSVTYFAADVYHSCHNIHNNLQKCPNSVYNLSMERLEKSLLWNPCGISLFGTFMITRKFFISIIGFLFSTQIVLLQTDNSSSNSCKS